MREFIESYMTEREIHIKLVDGSYLRGDVYAVLDDAVCISSRVYIGSSASWSWDRSCCIPFSSIAYASVPFQSREEEGEA